MKFEFGGKFYQVEYDYSTNFVKLPDGTVLEFEWSDGNLYNLRKANFLPGFEPEGTLLAKLDELNWGYVLCSKNKVFYLQKVVILDDETENEIEVAIKKGQIEDQDGNIFNDWRCAFSLLEAKALLKDKTSKRIRKFKEILYNLQMVHDKLEDDVTEEELLKLGIIKSNF